MSGEYDFEPVRGLPAHLPAGERLLWQGAPDWRSFACRVFHVRKIALYFAALAVWRGGAAIYEGESLAVAASSALWLAVLGLAALAILGLIAWAIGRTTVYSITSKRLIFRFGIALPMTINIPFKRIDSAALRAHSDGTGDLPLALNQEDRVAYLVMWPHARPWRLARPQPMLRCVPEAAAVSEILGRALATAAKQPQPRPAGSAQTAEWPGAEAGPLAPAVS